MKPLFTALLLAVLGLYAQGCQQESALGTDQYALNGKPIIPSNAVRVRNPYTCSVMVRHQGVEDVQLPGTVVQYIFRGMDKPGPIEVWELDAKGQKVRSLSYEESSTGLFGTGVQVDTIR